MSEAHESSAAPDRYAPPSKAGRRSSLKSDQPLADMPDRSADAPSERTAAKYLTVTIDADAGRVIRVDGVDDSGTRRELSSDERTKLVKDWSNDKVQDVVEQAFEAGIACVLGGDESDAAEESAEDVELRRRLLAPLIERSAVGRLMERGALNRAVLSTLVAHDT